MHSVFAALLICFAGAQAPDISKDAKPVTRSEFVLLFDRFTRAIEDGFNVPLPVSRLSHEYTEVPETVAPALQNLAGRGLFLRGSRRPFRGSTPISRFEVALSLDKFTTAIRPRFLRAGEDKKFDISLIRGRTSDGSQDAMLRLARGGFVPVASPLFAGPEETLKPATLAAVLAQAAENIGWHFRRKDSGG